MPLTTKSLGSFPNEMLSILDCALEGVMVADNNCVISYINPAYSRLTGLDPKQEIGRVLHDNIPSGPLREAITTGRPVYGRRYQPPGSRAELTVNAAPILLNNQIVGGVSFCQDISDILLLTKKLAQSTELVNTPNFCDQPQPHTDGGGREVPSRPIFQAQRREYYDTSLARTA